LTCVGTAVAVSGVRRAKAKKRAAFGCVIGVPVSFNSCTVP
jgi:hypothetical protein